MALHRWFRLYAYVVIVAAVLYGALGPVLDHHFTERITTHGHLYLSGVPWDHAHPYQETHLHDGSSTGDGLVFLPDRDAQPGVDASYVTQWIAAAAWLAVLPALLLVAMPLLVQWRPVSALVIPPTQPPRAPA
jgi:hypothetical protein